MSDLKIEFEKDKDLTKYSTMRLHAKGDLYTVKSENLLSSLLVDLNKKNQKFIVLGLGANQLKRNILTSLSENRVSF